jgi:RND family efflux transporter MFP subunit
MNWYQEHKKTTWLGGGAVVAVLMVGGMLYFFLVYGHAEQGGDSKSSQPRQSESMRVQVVYPKEGGVERLVRRPATVQAFEYADLYAKVSGYLRNQNVDIGSRVKENDILAEVYAPEKQADVKKAQADLEEAKANVDAINARLERNKADRVAAEKRYEVAKARLAADEAYRQFRVKQHKRYADLLANRAIDAQLVDEQEDRLQAAIAAVNADQEAVAGTKAEVDAAEARIKQTEADVKQVKAMVGIAKATLDRAKVWAEYTKILSPYTGVITERNFHNGDFIREAGGGGSKPPLILSVARTDKMRIIVQVPDRDVPYLKVGDLAELTIDTLPGRHFRGRVARMSYRENYETRTMRTEVDMPNPDELLEDGMYGEIIIHLGREKGMRIPSKCLTGNEKDEERSVFIVRGDRAKEVKVKVGIDDGIEATIREGLSMSDPVVVERSPGLADGMRVEVIHEGSEDTTADKQEKVKTSPNQQNGPATDHDMSHQKTDEKGKSK